MTTDSPENTAEGGVDVQRLVRQLDDFEQRKTARMQQERYGTGNSIYCEAIAVAQRWRRFAPAPNLVCRSCSGSEFQPGGQGPQGPAERPR